MERRQKILDAAERLLRHYGTTKTTVADIARAASVGVGTVYLEFDSKDAIIATLSGACYDTVLERMTTAAKAPGPYDARLRGIFVAQVEAFLALAEGGQHATELMHCACPGVETSQAGFLTHAHTLIAAFLTEADASGEFRVPAPARAADALMRAHASFTPPWLFHQPQDKLRIQLLGLHDLLLRGLRAR